MAATEPDVLAELRGLRARVPHVTGALAAGTDGLLLAQDTSGVSADQVAALITTALGIALRVTHATGQGGFRELLVRGSDGYVATYTAGRSTVLTLFAQDRVNVGRLHLEGRRTGLRIGELLDAEPAGSTVPAPDARTTRTTRSSGRPETPTGRTPPGGTAGTAVRGTPGTPATTPPTTPPTTTAAAPARSRAELSTELPTAPPAKTPAQAEAPAEAASARNRTAHVPRTTPNARPTTDS